jgi:hypothetical protein
MSITHQNQDSKVERQIRKLLALLPDGWETDTDTFTSGTTVGTAGVNVIELTYYNNGLNYITQLTLENVILGAPTAAGNSAHGALIYTFSSGIHVHTATYFDIGLTIGTVTTDTPDVGIGSVLGTGNHALLSDCDAGAEDYLTGQLWAVALAGGVRQEAGPLGATAGMLTGISLNKRTDAKTVYLNVADGWNAGITGNLIANGTVTLMWARLY